MRERGTTASRKAAGFSLATFLFGALMLGSTLVPGPFMEDKDKDGISDLYQKVTPLIDLRMDENGDWVQEEAGYGSEMDLPFLFFIGVALLVVLPSAVFLIVWNGPMRERRREQGERRAAMHDVVRRTAAFLEINPSLPSALRYSWISQDGAGREELGKLLWDLKGSGRTFREAYLGFSSRWEERDPSIGRALKGLLSAEGESTEEEVRGAARRTVEHLSEEARAQMESYIRSLSGPSTALFALGVLLPVLLATMIPISGMGLRTALMLGAVLWIGLPAGMMAFAGGLVRKRPAFGARKGIAAAARFAIGPLSAIAVLLGALCVVMGSILLRSGDDGAFLMGLRNGEAGALIMLSGAALLTAAAADAAFGRLEKERRAADEVRKAVPDVLQTIGSSIMDGRSFESSVAEAAGSADGTVGRELLLLMPHCGIVSDRFSRFGELDSSLKSARDFSRAGPSSGGRSIRALASHLEELYSLEERMEGRVKEAVGQMETTASIFAPVMIGTSVGIFRLMEGAGASTDGIDVMGGGGGGPALSVPSFILLSGGYLLILSVVTSLILFRLEKGVPGGGWHMVPKNVIRSAIAFTLGVIGSSVLLG